MGIPKSLIFLLVLGFTISIIEVQADVNLPLKPITGPIQGNYLDSAVTISLSKSCERLVSLNSTTCPSYFFFLDQKLDTSLVQSGKFEYKDGLLKRKHVNLINEENLYSFKANHIIVDPSHRLMLKIKTIEIVPSMESYLLPSDMIKQNNTRIVHRDIFIDDKCHKIVIAGKTFLKTIAEIIFYLRSNCDPNLKTFTNYDIITDNQTYIDITTTSEYKYQQWLLKAKQISKADFLIN